MATTDLVGFNARNGNPFFASTAATATDETEFGLVRAKLNFKF